MFAYYLHDLSPFLIRFTEKWGLRWYGLSYVAAFVVGFLVLRVFVRRGYCQLRESQVSDFITFAALLGVMLGGRLGYLLIYRTSEFLSNPLIIINVLDGGMASHGGILGLVVFTWVYARRKGITWRGLGDNLCTVAPLGLCFGRLANFINGELYGRKTDVSWAMQFPDELNEINEGKFEPAGDAEVRDLFADLASLDEPERYFSTEGEFLATQAVEASRNDPAVADVLREYLNARHPSQIYQALMEGLLLFIVLYVVRVRFPRLRHGVLTGLFFIGYAVFRILGEHFREPSDGFVGPFTLGQFLSLFMIAIGIAFIISAKVWPYRQKLVIRKPAPEPSG